MKLFDPCDGGIIDIVGLSMLVQCGVHLTSAEDKALALSRILQELAVFRVGNEPLEMRIVCEFRDVRSCKGVTQKSL